MVVARRSIESLIDRRWSPIRRWYLTGGRRVIASRSAESPALLIRAHRSAHIPQPSTRNKVLCNHPESFHLREKRFGVKALFALRNALGDTSHLIYFDVSAIRPIFRKGRASARKVFLSGSKGSVRYPSYPTRAILPGQPWMEGMTPLRCTIRRSYVSHT